MIHAICRQKRARDIFITGEIRDKNLLLRLPRPSKRPGCYLSFTEDSFTGKIIGMYVGQSVDVDQRTKAHASIIRREYIEKPTQYQATARQPGCRTYFVELVSYNREAVDLPPSKALFNILEMFFALFFQTLQRKQLAEWLPNKVRIRAGCGVNTALPLSQSAVDSGRMLLLQTARDGKKLLRVNAKRQRLSAVPNRRRAS